MPEASNKLPCKEGSTEPISPCKKKRKKSALTVRETAIFSMLGALMYCSKLLLEWAPNIHLLALFIITFTLAYRVKALIPIYVFVFLTMLLNGLTPWLVPYLYAWAVLWGATMLLPRRMKPAVAAPVYMVLGALHGLGFGVLCAPSQALLFNLDLTGTLAWIASGFYFDLLHGIGNFAACTLVLPLVALITKIEKRAGKL